MAASLVVLPSRSDAFQTYKPSTNAHTDILTASSQSSSSKGRVVQITLPHGKPDAGVDEQLKEVKDAIPLILAGKPASVSYHRLVEDCRRLDLDSTVDVSSVYKCIDKELKKTVKSMAREGRADILSRQGSWLLRIVQLWDTYQNRVGLLSSLLLYLDRSFSKEDGWKSISDLASDHFKAEIWDNEILYGKTVDDILAWVTADRQEEKHDASARAAVKDVVKLAAVLNSFTFFERYTNLTREYYEDRALERKKELGSGALTGTEYVKWATDKEVEESDRIAACFSPVTSINPLDVIVHIVRQETGSNMADLVVSKALDEAMYRADTEALSRLYSFCIHSDSFKTLAKALQDHIFSRISQIISDPANDPQMIDSTLKLKRFVDGAVASLFSSPVKTIQATSDEDKSDAGQDREESSDTGRTRQFDLEDAVRSGFKFGLRSRQNAPAEWIAKHLDSTMRKGPGSTSESEFNNLLDEIIALVGFTPDKDVFRAFYSTGLAKRLLLNKSASDDMERNMILKLQTEMGDEFTSGDTMMKDLQLSETLVKSYQSARAKNPSEFKDHSDFTANVLTEAAWPSYPLLKDGWDFKLTPQLQSSVDTFTEWYATQHKNRKLSWRHQLASATVTARFNSGKYEIGVSLFQTVVLLLFNDVDVLDFEEIKARTGIESKELVRTLQSLSLGRKGTRVLVKRPAGKEVEPTDKFAINKAFSSDRIKFKINQIQQDLSAEESRKTNEQVALDRVSVLEATIVRIMKGKKKLSLPLLIDAVVSDVAKRFPPDIKEIKKRVESLIEREFLMREESDRQMLQYLA